MERSLRIQMIALFLCIPLLAWVTRLRGLGITAWLPNHARIVAKLGSYLFAQPAWAEP